MKKLLQNILQIQRHGIQFDTYSLSIPSPILKFCKPRETHKLYDKFTDTDIHVIDQNPLNVCLKFNQDFIVTLFISTSPKMLNDILTRTLIYDKLRESKFTENDIVRIDNVDIVYDDRYKFIYPYPINMVIAGNYKNKWTDIIRACFGSDILVLDMYDIEWDDDFKVALHLANGKFKSIIIITNKDYQVFAHNGKGEELDRQESVAYQIMRAYPYVLADTIKWFLDLDFKKFKETEYFNILFPIVEYELGIADIVLNVLVENNNFIKLMETAIKLFYSYWGLAVAENNLEIADYSQFEKYFISNDTPGKLDRMFLSCSYFSGLKNQIDLFKTFISQIGQDYPNFFAKN